MSATHPQLPSQHNPTPDTAHATALADLAHQHTGVEEVFTDYAGQYSTGPLTLFIDTEAGVSVDQISAEIDADIPLPGAAAVTIRDGACGYDAGVAVVQHPDAVAVTDALRRTSDVGQYSVEWTPSFSTAAETGAVRWADTAALRVGVSVEVGATDDDDTARKTIVEAVQNAVVDASPVVEAAHVTRTEAVERTQFDAQRFDLVLGVEYHESDSVMTESRVYRGDSTRFYETMQSGGEKVQLTVTSPPYIDAIDYDEGDAGDGDYTAFTMEDSEVREWMEHQREVFSEVYDATREGGFCAVVVGTVKRGNGEYTPLPHKFAEVMEVAGWTFHESIVWNKPTGGSSRFGTTIQHPYPTYYYPNQMHEEIQVWRRGDVVRRKDDDSKIEITDFVKQEIANNVWNIPPVPHNKEISHPCPFPEELVHRLVTLYSLQGDVVADPMAGSGTTLKVADRLERTAVGMELRSGFVAEARRRLYTEQYERGEQITANWETTEVGDGHRSETDSRASDEDGGVASQAGLDEF